LKKKNNYYLEIDKELKSYEEEKPYHKRTIDYICNRIDWAWKWRKITKEQMEELTDRICIVLGKE
jgi:lipid A disaccharide synthetase